MFKNQPGCFGSGAVDLLHMMHVSFSNSSFCRRRSSEEDGLASGGDPAGADVFRRFLFLLNSSALDVFPRSEEENLIDII